MRNHLFRYCIFLTIFVSFILQSCNSNIPNFDKVINNNNQKQNNIDSDKAFKTKTLYDTNNNKLADIGIYPSNKTSSFTTKSLESCTGYATFVSLARPEGCDQYFEITENGRVVLNASNPPVGKLFVAFVACGCGTFNVKVKMSTSGTCGSSTREINSVFQVDCDSRVSCEQDSSNLMPDKIVNLDNKVKKIDFENVRNLLADYKGANNSFGTKAVKNSNLDSLKSQINTKLNNLSNQSLEITNEAKQFFNYSKVNVDSSKTSEEVLLDYILTTTDDLKFYFNSHLYGRNTYDFVIASTILSNEIDLYISLVNNYLQGKFDSIDYNKPFNKNLKFTAQDLIKELEQQIVEHKQKYSIELEQYNLFLYQEQKEIKSDLADIKKDLDEIKSGLNSISLPEVGDDFGSFNVKVAPVLALVEGAAFAYELGTMVQEAYAHQEIRKDLYNKAIEKLDKLATHQNNISDLIEQTENTYIDPKDVNYDQLKKERQDKLNALNAQLRNILLLQNKVREDINKLGNIDNKLEEVNKKIAEANKKINRAINRVKLCTQKTHEELAKNIAQSSWHPQRKELFRDSLGNKLKPPYWAAHHIVPEGVDNKYANEARDILKNAGIDIADESNGVNLPGQKKDNTATSYDGQWKNATPHNDASNNGVHQNNEKYCKDVLEVLETNIEGLDPISDSVKYREGVEKGLAEIRYNLLNGYSVTFLN